MTNAVLRLDTSKAYSSCHGERTPDDPHYRVCFWQGRKVGDKMVLLPFDSQGTLVTDDGKKDAFAGINVEGKPVQHQPLYNDDMRGLAERLKKRLVTGAKDAAASAALDDGAPVGADGDDDPDGNPADDVNFVSWLKGETKYRPDLLRSAYKKRYHKNMTKLSELVVELVLDEKIVPEDQVCLELKKYLPAAA